MRLPQPLAIVLCCGLIILGQPALAQNQAERASTTTQSQALTLDESKQAGDWGLQDEEWARYRELMRGPLGIHSPGLDPLTALGIEALASGLAVWAASDELAAPARRELQNYHRELRSPPTRRCFRTRWARALS